MFRGDSWQCVREDRVVSVLFTVVSIAAPRTAPGMKQTLNNSLPMACIDEDQMIHVLLNAAKSLKKLRANMKSYKHSGKC